MKSKTHYNKLVGVAGDVKLSRIRFNLEHPETVNNYMNISIKITYAEKML
jgi:hypothetical protein